MRQVGGSSGIILDTAGRGSGPPEQSRDIQIRPDTPPAFLAAAEDDTTAPYQNSLQYFMHLSTNAGVKMNRVGVYPNGGHGFNICFNDEGKYEVCNWPLKAKVWLEDLEYL